MTILQALAGYYDRLDRRGKDGPAIVPFPGFRLVEIDYVLEIDRDGRPIELRKRHVPDGRRRAGKLMMPGTAYNPKPATGESHWEDLSFGGRTSGRRSFVFWDKTSYVFGATAKKADTSKSPRGEKKQKQIDITKESREHHEAFVAAHEALIGDTDEPALRALLAFLNTWKPEDWAKSGFPFDALGGNVAIEVSGTRMRLDQLPKARELAGGVLAPSTQARHCLVTGDIRPFAVLHPQFRVAGAQSSGASLVSYNADAFISFEQDKAATAPVSAEAAFKYGAALNWLLDRDNGRMFRLGETTVVFWADDKSDEAAITAEEALRFEMPDAAASKENATSDTEEIDETPEEDCDDRDVDFENQTSMEAQAAHVRHLRREPDLSNLDDNTRLHVLGLSPNAGRIAVRFWLADTWGHLAENIGRFKQDVRIEPADKNPNKKAYAFLRETAVQGEAKNIPPRLGGEFARAILTGSPYPQTLCAAVIGRIRADKNINAARAGLCRAFIVRNFGGEDFPVALDPESLDEAYNLGRLFAAYEYAERSVADRNATIKDKFIGAASATPRRVFPILMRGYEHNASALAKGDEKKRGAGIKASKAVSQILAQFHGEMPFPTALRLDAQGRFFVGYYHQMQALYTKADKPAIASIDSEDTE